jgi:hypothetical protein
MRIFVERAGSIAAAFASCVLRLAFIFFFFLLSGAAACCLLPGCTCLWYVMRMPKWGVLGSRSGVCVCVCVCVCVFVGGGGRELAVLRGIPAREPHSSLC